MNNGTLREIAVRNDIARDVVAGFAAGTPTLDGAWTFVDKALADVPVLLADLARIRAELEAVRLDRANLLAAIRATLAASADAEGDPLWYIRDEVKARQMPPQPRREAS